MGYDAIINLQEIRDTDLSARLHDLIKNFDAQFYQTHKHHAGRADLLELAPDMLLKHFIVSGIKEGRSYNRFFHSFIEPHFYAERYPELGISCASESVRHWMYKGVYETRIPNSITQQLVDADIHLFQMGKVASKSIEASIYASGYDKIIPHLHWANDLVFSYPDCFYSYAELVNFNPKKKLLFISGFRDPIERVISGIFESVSEYRSSVTLERLQQHWDAGLEQVEKRIAVDLVHVLEWFDHGYYRSVDVYAVPFDHAKGYTVITKGDVTVFLYRLDALKDCWPALCQVAGLPSLELRHVNRSADKPIKSIFREWLDRTKLSADFIDQVAKSRFCRHFFTSDQRDVFRRRWTSVSSET